MIKANCRDRFTAADFEFVVRTLCRCERDAVSLVDLLTDAEMRDAILDHPVLLEAVLENAAALTISPQLYFYVLIRHVLKERGLLDRSLSDYVASLLENFSQTARLRSPGHSGGAPIQYVTDMLIALREASPVQSFLLRAHVGNYALFITGIFHDTVRSRSQRGGPNVSFYEEVGSANYRAAAEHHVARSAALTGIYDQLAAGFHEVRLALNRLADTLMHLDDSSPPAVLAREP